MSFIKDLQNVSARNKGPSLGQLKRAAFWIKVQCKVTAFMGNSWTVYHGVKSGDLIPYLESLPEFKGFKLRHGRYISRTEISWFDD
jgi:hypothetical protein